MANRWHIMDNGRRPRKPGDARVFVDGEDITGSVTGFTIRHDENELARIDLRLMPVVEITIVGDTEPRWHGLERVPTAALLSELGRREVG